MHLSSRRVRYEQKNNSLLFAAAAKIADDAPWRASGNGAVSENMAAELIGPDGWAECG
ncbi:MAG: hypothetical protein HAW59_03410 [Betaproteobacteria bacterium]|nr:hypothetical protein [Betaproteobacteria bacterium]